MNNVDKEYLRVCNEILTKGRRKKNRTGVDTFSLFGVQCRFDLSEGFPLLTTKKVFTKAVVHELLWFLSGSTNIKYLVDNDVHIWDADAYRKYKRIMFKENGGHPNEIPTKEWYIEQIKTNPEFANKWGELGEGTYGGMWRGFPYYNAYETLAEPQGGDCLARVDQIAKVIDTLKNNPDSRRIIVNAWHPYWVDHCNLPPCHVLFQFNTEELSAKERYDVYMKSVGLEYDALIKDEKAVHEGADKMGIPRRRLSCQLYQRSCDFPLGVPFNWASYSFLLSMVAQVVNMVPGDFVWTGGDVHIYENQVDGIKEQMTREPRELPSLKLNPEVKDIFRFKYEDITIEGYDPHPAIKMPLSVG